MSNLSELWIEARKYGLVNMHTMEDGTYWCHITFNSINHTELKAKSGFHHLTPESAIIAAINTAAEIVGEMANLQNKIISKA